MSKFFLRVCGFVSCVMLVVVMLLSIWLYGFFRDDIPKVLQVEDYKPYIKSKIYAQNGELIAQFGTHERQMVDKKDISPLVSHAFIASEDKKFFHHKGLDFVGMANAVLQSLSGRRSSLRGASTITQQLAKSLLIKEEGFDKATERTLSRKIKEAILARRLEMRLSKEDILYIYLNEVYLGHGAYGIAAAANNYFRKKLEDLSLGEIAMMAGLPQAPSRYSPQNNMSSALARQKYVLGRMLEDGYIKRGEYDEAFKSNENIKIYPRKNKFRATAPYFSEIIRQQLVEQYGEDAVYKDGLNIYTSLNLEHARAMQETVHKNLINIDKRQGFSGAIFKPSSHEEVLSARDLIARINDQDQFMLGADYKLAMVLEVNRDLEGVFVHTGQKKGVIPLAGLRWARERDAKKNYAWHQLRSVGDTLQVNDVILIKRQSYKQLDKKLYASSQKRQLKKLVDRFKDLDLFSLEQEPSVEGAMISIETGSGYVTALSGGYSFDKSKFNRVFQACRQPGSVFKPVVYSAAIALKDYTPATIVLDAPLTFHDKASEMAWKPKNFGQKYKGEVTMREAITRSMNVPTLNIMAQVGIGPVLRFARKMGIKTRLKPELGTAIGSSCVTPWELAKVFSVIANEGQRVEPVMITKILDRDGKSIRFNGASSDPWQLLNDRFLLTMDDLFKPKEQVLSKEDAYTMHYLLTQVAKHGTASRTNALGRSIAGKTGTTNESYDTWFAGYSRDLISVVWVGNDTMSEPLGVYEQGARTALPLFNQYFSSVLKRIPDRGWGERPHSMCEARIDAKTGLRIEYDHPLSFIAPFKCGYEPALLVDNPQQSFEETMQLMGGM